MSLENKSLLKPKNYNGNYVIKPKNEGSSFGVKIITKNMLTPKRNEWPENLAELIAPLWQEPYGDRQQEMVMIGQNMDIESVQKKLQTCLLTEEEYNQGHQHWTSLSNPFSKDWEEFYAEASN